MADEVQETQHTEETPHTEEAPVVQEAEPVVDEVAKAKALLEEEAKKRVAQCAQEIDVILKKYNCRLETFVQIQTK